MAFAVAQVERNLVIAVTEDIKIPHYPNVPGNSWNKDSDHALIPKETIEGGKGVWQFSCCQCLPIKINVSVQHINVSYIITHISVNLSNNLIHLCTRLTQRRINQFIHPGMYLLT